MAGTLSALYASRAEAEEALDRLLAEADLGGYDIIDEGPARGHLLTAEVASHTSPDKIARILDDYAVELERRRHAAPAAEGHAVEAASTGGFATTRDEPAFPRPEPPAPGEELHTGRSEIVRGGAQVRFLEQAAVDQPPVRLDDIEARPVLGDGELAAGGVLQARDVELEETAEEPVVTRRLFVREEVVIRKSTDTHSEEIVETVRRTEVDVERFGNERAR